MIIILEGPDGAGKTTLAEALRQRLQQSHMTQIVKHGPYTNLVPEELCKIFFRSMTQALTYNDHVIMDRSCLLLSTLHCQPSFDLCAATFTSRSDDEYLDNVDQLRQVYDEYESLKLHTSLPVIHYDYQYDEVDDLLAKVKAASIENGAEGGGAFKEGNYLILCDRGPRTNVRPGAAVVPFINFLDNDGPSRMLAEALEREGVPESKCYWVNTQTFQGVPTNPAFVRELKPSRVFALGNNAYTWALNNSVQAHKLPPPLYHMQNYPNQPYHITEADYGNDD